MREGRVRKAGHTYVLEILRLELLPVFDKVDKLTPRS